MTRVATLFRKHFDYDLEAASDESAVLPVGDSLTVQAMAEDADLNVLMRRYGVTGKLPENPRIPSYGDFSGVVDFQSALNAVMEASEAFNEFPAELRARFDNSPQRMLEFVSDPANRQVVLDVFGKAGEQYVVRLSGSGGGGAPPAPQGAGGAPGSAAGGNAPAAGGGGAGAPPVAGAGAPAG